VDVREPNPRVLAGDYTPHSAVNIFVKELGIIHDMASVEKFPCRSPPAALQMFLMGTGWDMG
jgi:L-threonate 2-dehydrogenase